jgi:hypothetical protein
MLFPLYWEGRWGRLEGDWAKRETIQTMSPRKQTQPLCLNRRLWFAAGIRFAGVFQWLQSVDGYTLTLIGCGGGDRPSVRTENIRS